MARSATLLAGVVGVLVAAMLCPAVPTAAAATPSGAIVAFGDSVAAGYGYGHADGQGNDNQFAYPAKLAASLDYSYSNFAAQGACAGIADAADCGQATPVSDQIDEAVGALAGKPLPQAITLTVGADSIDFVGCLTAYLDGERGASGDPCQTGNLQTHLNALEASLGSDLRELQRAFPGVPILVTSYYDPAPAVGDDLSCGWGRVLSLDDVATVFVQQGVVRGARYAPGFQTAARTEAALRSFESSMDYILRQLNGSIGRVVASVGATLVDIGGALNGRGLCSSAPLLFSPTLAMSGTVVGKSVTVAAPSGPPCPVPEDEPSLDKGFSFTGLSVSLHSAANCFPHPTAAGQAAIAAILRPHVPSPVPVPSAPVLRTTATTASSISLAWTAVTGAVGYQMYEGTAIVATTTVATSTTIGGLASNSTHSYLVKAYNSAGLSPPSNIVSATTNSTYLYAVTGQIASADVGHARPGEVITITINVRNTGTATWQNAGSNAVNLATVRPQNHASPFQSRGWISPSRPATLQQASVLPGGTGTFSFPVTAPESAGTIRDYFSLVAENKSWFNDPGTYVEITTQPIVGVAAVPGSTSYWTVADDGGVTTSAGAPFYGSMGGQHLNAPIVGVAARSSGGGYWLVGADGGVFAYGAATFYGSMAGQPLSRPIVGIASTPDGNGYWLVGADGGVFAYGDAGFAGSMAGQPLNRPIVGIAAGPDDGSYRLTGADGGVFAYGAATFYGSMAGQPLNRPIVGIASTPDGNGYWLVGADGGVYAYGEAIFGGSLGTIGSAHPITGITRTSAGYAISDSAGLVTGYSATPPPLPPATLYPGSQLNPGAGLVSPNSRYRLVMQVDGNLVEYDGQTAVWASNTFAAGSVLIDQSDGNFVIVAPGNVPVWATGTNRPNSVLTVQDDRNVVVYAPGNVPVWATGTNV